MSAQYPESQISASDLPTTVGHSHAVKEPITYPQDEIDLVELLAFVWSLRKWTLAGILLGIVGVALYLGTTKSIYNVRIPVSVDSASLPAVTDPAAVVSGYTSAFASSDFAFLAVQTLVDRSPGLANALKAQGISVTDLASDLINQESGKKNANPPIAILPGLSASDFFFETKLPVRGLGSNAVDVLLGTLNSVGTSYNKVTLARATQIANIQLNDAQLALKELNENAEGGIAPVYVEQTKVRSDLANLEYRLNRRVSGLSPVNFADVSSPGVRFKRGEGIILQQESDMIASIRRILRLKAALIEEKKISDAEASEVQNHITELQRVVGRIERQTQSFEQAAAGIWDRISSAQQAAAMPVEREKKLLPLFRLDPLLLAELGKDPNLEKRTTKVSLVALAGVMLGAFFGFGGGATLRFIRRNRKRLGTLAHQAELD